MSDFVMTLSSGEEDNATVPVVKTENKKKKKRVNKKRNTDDIEDEEAMEGDFMFDGLGGGFVGSRRNEVWDGGVTLSEKKSRITVEDIIRRREKYRRQQEAEQGGRQSEQTEEASASEGSISESGKDAGNDLEQQMLAELSDEEGAASEASETSEASHLSEEASDVDSDSESDNESDNESDDEHEDNDNKETSEFNSAFTFAALEEENLDGDEGAAAAASSDEESEDAEDPMDDEEKKKAQYFTKHTNTVGKKNVTTFANLPGATLSRPILLGLSSLSLNTPTPIQTECIPIAMQGLDIVANSKTGSGKTVAFWVGILERLLLRDRKHLATRVVVITPTRELAVQVHGVGIALSRYTDITFALCVGGLSLKVQEAELKKRPDVVVSTPGRLIDHLHNTPSFTMDEVEVLVLDEADRMLEEGFHDELQEIIQAAPRSRQTLLFSATITESISSLSRLSMNKPVRVKIDETTATANNLTQEFVRVRGDRAGESIERGSRSGERAREAILVHLCSSAFHTGKTIIFFRSKAQAHRMKIIFTLYGQGLELSAELHGDLTQEQRLLALQQFRDGTCLFLLATDLASRGLDIKGIEHVINYEMPKSHEIYIHRVGRTARAGNKGRSLTLVGESDRALVKQVIKNAPEDSIIQRTLASDVLRPVLEQLRALEPEIKEVRQEEEEEKALRRGDMELEKAQNLLKYRDEINARPARTWFQTESEKQVAKKAGIGEHNDKFVAKNKNKDRKSDGGKDNDGEPKKKRHALDGLSRREKRRKMAMWDDERDESVQKRLDASVRAQKKAARVGKISDPNSFKPAKKPKKAKRKRTFSS